MDKIYWILIIIILLIIYYLYQKKLNKVCEHIASIEPFTANNTQFICNNGSNDTLTSADIYSGGWMDAIRLKCSSGKEQKFGGEGGGLLSKINLGNSMVINTSPFGFIARINGMGGSFVQKDELVSCKPGQRLIGMEVETDRNNQWIQKLSLLCE